MTRILFYGLLTGFYISTGFIASEVLFPSPAFGTLPVWLAIFIFAADILIRGTKEVQPPSSKVSAIVMAAIAAVLPFAVFGLYLVTDYGALISQNGGPKVILLLLMYVILVAIPVALLTRGLPQDESARDVRTVIYALFGAAVGLFLHQQLAGSLDLPVLVVLTAVATLAFPFIKAQSPGNTEKASPKKREQKKTSPKSVQAKKGGRSERKKTTVQKYHPVYTYITAFVLFALFPAWLLAHLQKAEQFLLAAGSVHGLLLPVIAAATAAGLFLSLRLGSDRKVYALIGGLALFAAGIILGTYRWQHTLFPDLYAAYYNGADTTYFLGEWLAFALVIPSFAAGFLLGIVRGDLTANKRIANAISSLPGWIAIGLFATAVLTAESVHLLYLISGLYLSFFLIALVGIHFQQKLFIRIPVTLGIGAGLIVLTLNLPAPGFENLFDPASFKIVYEDQGPGGRTTLLKSRNYDDPFYTVFWNQAMAISQNSNDAKPDLQRVVHVPMMMHPASKNILLLGMGSFEEMATLDLYEPESVVVVEHNPAHISCYKAWLADQKKETPEYLRFHAERWPAFAARNNEQFDLIISGEPFATPHRGPRIFTTSYFGDLKRAAGENGLFVQWLPLDGLTEGTLASITSAISGVFPHTRLWTGSMNEGSTMAAILASNSPIAVPKEFRTVLQNLGEKGTTAFELLRSAMPSWEYIAAEYGGNQAVIKSIAGNAEPPGSFDSKPLYSDTPQNVNPDLTFMQVLQKRNFEPALIAGAEDSVAAIVTTLFNSRPQVFQAASRLRSMNDTAAARILLNITREQPYNLEAKIALANGFVRQGAQLVAAGQYAAAQPILLQATSIAPLTTYTLRLLLIASFQIGDLETAQTCLDGIKRLAPKHAGVKDNEATIKAQKQQVQDALLIYENAITLDPTNEEFYCNMASVQYNGGRPWEAVRILDNAIKQSYYPAKAYFLRGMIYGEGGKIDLALQSYEEYFRIAKPTDPNLEAARENVRKLVEEDPL